MNNNYPYNPYNYNPQQYQQQYQRMQQNAAEKRELRHRSTLLACGIIIYVVLSAALVYGAISTRKLNYLYNYDSLYSSCIQILVSIPSLIGAYLITKRLIDKKHEAFIPFGKPANKKHALLLIPFGVAACLAGSYATGYIDMFLEDQFNVVFSQPELLEPKTGVETLVYIISMTIVPAFTEEIALRAGALQAMRKYGDWFAIVTSSFIFAILHGNMIQTPFAFIAGIALGYIFIATGSIWPGIIVHFINNLASSLASSSNALGLDEKTVDIVFGVYALAAGIAGTVCFIIYAFDKKKPVLNKDASTLTLPQKIGAFIINIPMIASILYVSYVTAKFIAVK